MLRVSSMYLCRLVLSSFLTVGAAHFCPDPDCASSIGLLQFEVNFSGALHHYGASGGTSTNRLTSQEGSIVGRRKSNEVHADVQSRSARYVIHDKGHEELVTSGIHAWISEHPFVFWNSVLLLIVFSSLMLHLKPMLANLGSSEQAPEQTDAGKFSSSTWKAAASVTLYGGLYILFSCTLIKYNKYLMTKGRFPFAVNLTLGHQASGSVFLCILYRLRPSLFPSLVGSGEGGLVNRATFFRGFIPVAICFSGQLVLSNTAYIYTSVAFLQMMKEGNMVLVYTLSLVAGLEIFHSVRARVLLCLMLSTFLTIQGQIEFSMTGFLVQASSQLMEATKIVLQSVLLSAAGSAHLDAYTYNLMVQATTAVLLLGFLCVCIGFIPHVPVASVADYVAWGPHLMVNGCVALALNVVVALFMTKSSAVGYIICGIIKDMFLISFDVLLSGTQISTLQIIAFGLQLMFVACYSLLKIVAKQREPPPESSKAYVPEQVPTQDQTLETVMPRMLQHGLMHKKFGRVFLKKGAPGETVETIVNRKLETTNTVKEGDWISRADTTSKELLILPDHKRQKLYSQEPVPCADHPDMAEITNAGFTGPYAPLGRCLALEVSPALLAECFPAGSFQAPWGEPMIVQAGDYLVAPAPPEGRGNPKSITEVYRIEKQAFQQTYARE